jgi:hypothetical protein
MLGNVNWIFSGKTINKAFERNCYSLKTTFDDQKNSLFGNPAFYTRKTSIEVIDLIRGRKGSIPLEEYCSGGNGSSANNINHSLIADLTDRNAAMISCDTRHLPSGLMLPLDEIMFRRIVSEKR